VAEMTEAVILNAAAFMQKRGLRACARSCRRLGRCAAGTAILQQEDTSSERALPRFQLQK